MHIVCPHCTTSFAINLATLGAAGRNVRCSRCKEIWLARPEDAVEIAPAVPAMAEASQGGGMPRPTPPPNGRRWPAQEEAHEDAPVVDSPSISADWPAEGEGRRGGEADWPSVARQDAEAHEEAVSHPSLAVRQPVPTAARSADSGHAERSACPRRLRRDGRAGRWR